MINHYQILNISENATDEEIKIAYRKLAILYHPDTNKNIDANKKFVEIKNSYDILLNPVKRKKFDKELEIQRLKNKIHNELNEKIIKSQQDKTQKKYGFRKFTLIIIIVISIFLINHIIKSKNKENISNI